MLVSWLLFVFKTIMNTLVCLDVRRRISEKDEGIYIHDFSKGERIKLRKAKSNS